MHVKYFTIIRRNYQEAEKEFCAMNKELYMTSLNEKLEILHLVDLRKLSLKVNMVIKLSCRNSSFSFLCIEFGKWKKSNFITIFSSFLHCIIVDKL